MKYRTVCAYFAGNPSQYYYYVPEGDNPAVGDIIITSSEITSTLDTLQGSLTAESVIAWSSNRFSNGSKSNLAVVAEVHDVPSTKASRFYLALLDRKAMLENHLNTGRLKALLEKRKEALAALERMSKEQDRMAVYRRLAETNPEAQRLLDLLNADLSSVRPLEVESEEDPSAKTGGRRKPTTNDKDPDSLYYDA